VDFVSTTGLDGAPFVEARAGMSFTCMVVKELRNELSDVILGDWKTHQER